MSSKQNLFQLSKSAQVQVAFNWVYILIAGAVILMFFVGIVVKQKSAAEEDLQRDVVDVLESILIGASVSEKTMSSIKTSGLSNYVFEFKCEEGISNFGIKGRNSKSTKLQPIFAPKNIQTTKLLLWSLPYHFPYKIMDLLIVSSSNNKYFVVGSSSPFWNRLEKAIKSEKKTSQNFFNVEFVKDLTTLVPGKTNQIRIVDLVGTYIQDKGLVPTPLIKLADSQVTAVSFVGGITATYYQKKGRFWEKIDTTKIISLGDQPDSAKFAAIFSENGKSYQCNMMKVFRRMQYLNEIYGGTTGSVGGKLKEILSYYQKPTAENKNECQLILHKQKTTNIQNILQRIKGATSTCIVSGYSTCSDVLKPAQELKRLNKELQSKSCIQLY